MVIRRKRNTKIILLAALFGSLTFFCCPSLFSNELSNSELFLQGNELYKNEEYDKAIELYDQILARGIENGPLFYNLGNAHFKQGTIGYSILYYEKALRYLPRDKELAENIAYARAFLQDRIQEKELPFIVYTLSAVLSKFTLREIAIFASFLVSFTTICGILLFYKKSLFLKNAAISLLVISILACLLFGAKYRHQCAKRGVVTGELAEIKSAPSESAITEFIIHEGTDFYIIESIKEWVKIRLRDGKTGWTTVDAFEPI